MEFEKFDKILKESINEFREIKKFGYIGLFGSLNMGKDLDMLVLPSKNVNKGEFMVGLNRFLEKIESKFPENVRLILLTYSVLEEEVEHISDRGNKDVFLHIATFPDLAKKYGDLVKKLISNGRKYYGYENIVDKLKKSKNELLYETLWFRNCLYSKYPKRLENKKMIELFKYIIENSQIPNKRVFSFLCKAMDESEKQYQKHLHS